MRRFCAAAGWAGPRPLAALGDGGVRCRLHNLSGDSLQLARGEMGAGSLHAGLDAVVGDGQLSGWASAPPPLAADFGCVVYTTVSGSSVREGTKEGTLDRRSAMGTHGLRVVRSQQCTGTMESPD